MGIILYWVLEGSSSQWTNKVGTHIPCIWSIKIDPPPVLTHPYPWFKLLYLCQQFSLYISIPEILLSWTVNSNSSSSYLNPRFPRVSWLSKWHHHSLKYSSQKLTVILHTLNFHPLYIIFRNTSSIPPMLSTSNHHHPSLFNLTWDLPQKSPYTQSSSSQCAILCPSLKPTTASQQPQNKGPNPTMAYMDLKGLAPAHHSKTIQHHFLFALCALQASLTVFTHAVP